METTIKKACLEGDEIAFIKSLLRGIGKEGVALAAIASKLKTWKPYRFKNLSWAGFPGCKQAILSRPKFFTVFYPEGNRTDCRVRLTTDEEAQNLNQGNNSSANIGNAEASELSIDNIILLLKSDHDNEQILYSCGAIMHGESPEIAYNALEYRFYKLEKEGKVIRKDNLVAFDSGLVIPNGLYRIYVVAEKYNGSQCKVSLLSGDSHNWTQIRRKLDNRNPEAADFTHSNFDKNRDISLSIGHILLERWNRLPEVVFQMVRSAIRNQEDETISNEKLVNTYYQWFDTILRGALNATITKLRNDVIDPVPFWYKAKDKMCWLIPLTLGIEKNPDIALVLDEEGTSNHNYNGLTILTLEQAYIDALAVGKVKADWLKPRVQED